ncbi:glycoside hydrolase family 2, partial [Klebsiella pneumoniae]|nr:glycoside hydrolase family 2 [Klebsiella pneumoniae]
QPMLRAEIRYRAVTPGPVTLRLTATPDNFSGPRFHQAFAVTLEKTAGVLHVSLPMPSAKLWWPVGAGKPNLYRVRATLTDDRGMMDTAVTRTGL